MIIQIDSESGELKTIGIAERHIEEDGVKTSTRCYELADAAGIALGDICFHHEDPSEWIYAGTGLTDIEQEQVVEGIRRNLNLNN